MRKPVEFRDRVGVMVDGQRRDGQVIEVARPSPLAYATAAIGGSSMVRVWLDGDAQPMQEMIPERELYR